MPSEPAYGWALRYSAPWHDRPWLGARIYWTRSEAIEHYETMFANPGQYRRDRRKGRVRAVRAKLVEAFANV